MNPLIALARELRDGFVWLKRKIRGQMTHGEVIEVQKLQPQICPEPDTVSGSNSCPDRVQIRFLGLFDTVEAYGVPLEDLRKMINWWLWPIMFRNRTCSAIVRNVKHALSLDDERLSFHPLRFDQGKRSDGKIGPRIEEVWFAGVHSDVGGGYVDDEASFEPLLWIADEAARQELRFVNERLERYRDRIHKHATLHDSRGGLAATYRYCPRPIQSGAEWGGVPIVDQSVLQKMLSATGGYAPLTLPDEFCFLPSEPDRRQEILPKPSKLRRDPAATERLEATILWRRIANMSFVGSLVLIGIFPWVATFIDNRLGLDQTNGLILGEMSGILAGLIPGFLSPWVTALWKFPIYSVPLVAAAGMFLLANVTLRDMIRDQALAAWTGTSAATGIPPPPARLTSLGTWLRTSGVFGWLYRVGAEWLTPTVLFAAAVMVLLYSAHAITLRAVTAAAGFCRADVVASVEAVDLLPGQTRLWDGRRFSPSDPCWFTGVTAVKGRAYWIRLDVAEPFFDGDAAASLAGFASCSPVFDLSAPFLRSKGRWFQPVAQIGLGGASILPLERFGGPPTPPSTEVGESKHQQRSCPRVHSTPHEPFVAKLTAEADGPLFLFVNDAVPFGIHRLFTNNTGEATVIIRAEAPGL